jgi:hypothetical protein
MSSESLRRRLLDCHSIEADGSWISSLAFEPGLIAECQSHTVVYSTAGSSDR